MEGGVRGGFPYGNFQSDHQIPLLRAKPPLTAIDRFLCGHNQNPFPSQPEILSNFKNRPSTTFFPENYVSSSDFTSPSTGGAFINGHAAAGTGGAVPWQSLPHHDTSFLHGIVSNEQNLNWAGQEVNHPSFPGYRDEENPQQKNPRKREKCGSSSSVNLIKGQWTEDEDSKLKKLVKHFGVKKWAQIAEKMVGRAGKQCRERWHNHLRPDIKKGTWCEEEERLLVEAHMQVGNRWAEIAKRIPGKTENSIKNHWNATKRRQNSRRKSKKPEGQNGKHQSTILQDYINSTTATGSSAAAAAAATAAAAAITPSNSATTTTTPPNSAVSEDPTSAHFNDNPLYPELSHSTSDDSPSYLARHSYDDEMNFMQNLFANNACGASFSLAENTRGKPLPPPPPAPEIKPFDHQGFSGNLGCVFFPPFVEPNLPITNKNQPQQDENINHQAAAAAAHNLYPDLYNMPHLWDKGVNNGNLNVEMMMDQTVGSSERKEVDLIEMVSNSRFPRRNATNNFTF